jgi:hypothetical protein
MINEVKIGDIVSFRHNKKQVTGKVIHRHVDKEKAFLAGHVNVEIEGGSSYPVTVHVSKLKPAVTEETYMENIREHVDALVDSIEAGNNIDAQELFDSILQNKINKLMDEMKMELSSTLFDTSECADCEQSVEEAKKMKDGKEAEKDEEEEEDEEVELDEALKGKQHKIDANKNGKLDAHDFKLLRAKKGVKEENELEEGIKDTVKKYAKKTMHTAAEVGDALVQGAVHGLSHGASNPAPMSTYSHIKPFKKLANKVAKEENELEEGIKDTVKKYAKKTMHTAAEVGDALVQGAVHGLSHGASNPAPMSTYSHIKPFKKLANKVAKEEAEQIDEYQKGLFRPPTGFTKKGIEKGGGVKTTLHYAKKNGSEPVGATMTLGRTTVPLGKTPPKPTRRVKEEVEQVDELKKSTLQSYADKVGGSRGGNDGGQLGGLAKKAHAEVKSGNTAAAQKTAQKFVKREKGLKTAVDKLHQKRFQKEEIEQVDEVITKKTPTGEVIKDFVHSKNPKFKGKSKKERIRMALGAKYAMMKKEEVELDEGNKENKAKKNAHISATADDKLKQSRHVSAAANPGMTKRGKYRLAQGGSGDDLARTREKLRKD